MEGTKGIKGHRGESTSRRVSPYGLTILIDIMTGNDSMLLNTTVVVHGEGRAPEIPVTTLARFDQRLRKRMSCWLYNTTH